jgi:hypothetical protein
VTGKSSNIRQNAAKTEVSEAMLSGELGWIDADNSGADFHLFQPTDDLPLRPPVAIFAETLTL